MYFGNYEVQPMSTIRSASRAHGGVEACFRARVLVDDHMTKVAALRAKSKDEFEKRYETS